MPAMHRGQSKSFVYFIAIVAALAGLLFGMDCGVISGALPGITTQFHLSLEEKAFVVSSLSVGAMVGVFLSQPISRFWGRRVGLIISAIIFTVTSIFLLFVPTLSLLIATRLILGLAIGIVTFATPLYLAEVAPRSIRGGMISTYQLMVAIGFLLAYVNDAILSTVGNWHLMLSTVAVPSFLMLIFVLFLPRSPRWLILNQREGEARTALARTLSYDEVDISIREIKESLRTSGSLKKVLTNKAFLSVIFLGLVMQFFQQWTGNNAVNYYVPTIFRLAGFVTLRAQMICAILLGCVHVSMTLVAIKYIDRWGRRPILFLGLSIMALGMLMLAMIVYHGPTNDALRALGVLSTLIYAAGFSISVGPVVWVICSEIFPLKARDIGITITTAGNWLFNFSIAQSFPELLHKLSGPGVFLLFVAITLVGILFVKFYVPEARGISLERLEMNLERGTKLRDIGVKLN